MTTIVANGYVTVVKAKYGMEATVYKDEFDAVAGMIGNGSLGGGSFYGCDEHKAALDRVEARIAEVRKQILEAESRTAWMQGREC